MKLDLVGMIIQDEAMNVARSVPHGAYFHMDRIYLPSLPFHWKGSMKTVVLRDMALVNSASLHSKPSA